MRLLEFLEIKLLVLNPCKLFLAEFFIVINYPISSDGAFFIFVLYPQDQISYSVFKPNIEKIGDKITLWNTIISMIAQKLYLVVNCKDQHPAHANLFGARLARK